MNHWDPYMNGPFSTSSGHDNEAGWMENNVPPMAPLSATTPNEATPTQVMPMAYYPPAAPYGYWCPPVAPPAPLVSPVHLDSPDSPDSSDMMLPAPPLGLGAGPNMAHASVLPMGGKENTPPMTPDDAAIPYGMTAPYAENAPRLAARLPWPFLARCLEWLLVQHQVSFLAHIRMRRCTIHRWRRSRMPR